MPEFHDRIAVGAPGRDPSNTDIDDLVEPLEPDDNVFTLVNPDQGDLRETAPAGADEPEPAA